MNAPLPSNLTERRVAGRVRTGAPAPGFAGPGHTAVEVVRADALAQTDPFVLLMDDRIDFKPGQHVGEAHPHAGIETVTLILEGALDDSAEGRLGPGDLAWMTAGRGIIHNEDVRATGKARILQLWVMLPRAARASDPDLQIVPLSAIPVRREPGVEARLYSGNSGTLRSPTRNRVPVTMVDFALASGTTVSQELPGTYTAFLYVIDGSVRIGDEILLAGDVGWLSCEKSEVTSLTLQAGPAGARVILYAGEPQHERILQRGPFVAGSDKELAAYYNAYKAGTFRRVSELSGRLSQ